MKFWFWSLLQVGEGLPSLTKQVLNISLKKIFQAYFHLKSIFLWNTWKCKLIYKMFSICSMKVIYGRKIFLDNNEKVSSWICILLQVNQLKAECFDFLHYLLVDSLLLDPPKGSALPFCTCFVLSCKCPLRPFVCFDVKLVCGDHALISRLHNVL